MNENFNQSLLDVLLAIASDKLEVGIHLENESILLERTTIILFKDYLVGINWFGCYKVVVRYNDIKSIEGCDIDVDVDEYGIVSAIPYPVKRWIKKENNRFNRVRVRFTK